VLVRSFLQDGLRWDEHERVTDAKNCGQHARHGNLQRLRNRAGRQNRRQDLAAQRQK
jgi:hypothetical protein